MNIHRRSAWLALAAVLWTATLGGDFYAKVPEFDAGGGGGDYDLYRPPWYPYDITEAEKYTVDEAGERIEREEDDGLDSYGEPKVTKPEKVKTALRKVTKKLLFEKVVGSPKVIVLDFYGHIPILAFDLPSGWSTGTQTMHGGPLEFGGDPPIPGDNRMLYDAWCCALITGWWGRAGGYYPQIWKGLLIPNLREFATFMAGDGDAVAKHAQLLLERGSGKGKFNPGLAVLRALSGKDYGENAGKWLTEVVGPIWTTKLDRPKPDYSSWEAAVKTLMVEDLSAKRVPAVNAFHRLRDVPELAEKVFLDMLERGELVKVQKRNLAKLLQNFSSPKAAQALHKLARDKDVVTQIRAVRSLAAHPHGRVRQILLDWLKTDDDILRATAILMAGRSRDAGLAEALMTFEPTCKDDQERELVLRSLMRLRHKPALELFKKHDKSKFETLAYTCRMGRIILGDLGEGPALDMIKEAFRREDAYPGSGKVVSFVPWHRYDLVKWMAASDIKRVRRKLWLFIREYKNLGPGSEEGGTPPLLAYALDRIKIGDDILPEKEAVKILGMMVERSVTDPMIRIAALGRLYEFNEKACLKTCSKVIERFLKGRKVGDAGPWDVNETDVLAAMLNLVAIATPDDYRLFEKVLTNPNFDGHMKSQLLLLIYDADRKVALKLVRNSLKYYLSQSNLSGEDERFLIRLMRFAGLFQQKGIVKDLFKVVDKDADGWRRFMAAYALRLSLETDAWENVVTGQAADRNKLIEHFQARMKDLKIK